MASPDAPSSHSLPGLPLLRRYPVTLVLMLVLAVVGIVTGSAWQAVPRYLIHDVGFRPSDGLALDLGRLLGAAWFTTDPWSLLQALVLTGVGVGLLERHVGSGWSALAFVGLHVVSFLTVALLYALPLSAGLVRNARDIGASAGYFGALAAVAAMTPRWRWLVPAFALLVLIGWLDNATAHGVLGRDVNAGAEHLFTVLYGGSAGWIVGERRRAGLRRFRAGLDRTGTRT